MSHRIKIILLLLLSGFLIEQGRAQSVATSESPVSDSLAALPDTLTPILQDYFRNYRLRGFEPNMAMRMDSLSVDDKARTLTVWAGEGFSSQNFTPSLVKTIYQDVSRLLPTPLKSYKLSIMGHQGEISTMIPNTYLSPKDSTRLWGKTDYTGKPWVSYPKRPYAITKGLSGRHLCIWASHGRYWLSNGAHWGWQRPALYCTREDLFTQSLVYPFLLPMLERSGAVCYTPRERDWQRHEIIVDNDGALATGRYEEYAGEAGWQDTGLEGFRYGQATYLSGESPWHASRGFTFVDSTGAEVSEHPSAVKGTARVAATTTQRSGLSTIYWIPNIEEAGDYAVYVSYQTLSRSIDDAHYTVHHRGISTPVRVNQQMGGGTWVYLGTYSFAAGQSKDNCVSLSNASSAARGVVTADAVRFGGGMGNMAREEDGGDGVVSGLPRYLEGSRYYVQWAGLPQGVYNTKDGHNDYADDINCRSNALNYLGGGSVYLPGREGGHVPFELSLAVHSDAGYRYGNDTYGTLVVTTLYDDSARTTLPCGQSRLMSSDLGTMLQTQICGDLTRLLGRTWTRREHYYRDYSESRKPLVPSGILETMSHQHFEDMKLGHDPVFKFAFARSAYKAIVRYIAEVHRTDYVYQPLPVTHLSALLEQGGKVRLSWSPQQDTTAEEGEASSQPDAYIVYTRKGDGDFDNGTLVKGTTTCLVSIPDDKTVSFKVTAVNQGGESFDSEVLSVRHSSRQRKEVLLINAFTRLSGPEVVDTEERCGFDLDRDMGVPYKSTTEYCGRQTDMDRTDLGRGLGRSGDELVGAQLEGNTFDYPYVHGQALAGMADVSFSSISREALSADTPLRQYQMLDLILGSQRDCGESSIRRYKTFDPALQRLLSDYLSRGGRLLVSGSYIASDMQSPEEAAFTATTLHYQYGSSDVAAGGSAGGDSIRANQIACALQSNPALPLRHYDRLTPVDQAFTSFTYSDGTSAAVAWQGSRSRTLALGFPLEQIADAAKRSQVMRMACRFLTE